MSRFSHLYGNVNVPTNSFNNETAANLDRTVDLHGEFSLEFARSATRLLAAWHKAYAPWRRDFLAVRIIYVTIGLHGNGDRRTRYPRLRAFGTMASQLKAVARAEYALGSLVGGFDPNLARLATDAMYAVYLSFWLRRQAVTRELIILEKAIDRDVNNPPAPLLQELEPKPAHAIVQRLHGLDPLVNYAYDVILLQRGERRLFVYPVSLLCMRVISLQLEEQESSGQSFEEFFQGLTRPAAYKWLLLVQIGLTDTMAQHGTHLFTSKYNILKMAEAATEPVMGVVAQGRFLRYLFGHKSVLRVDFRDQPPEVRAALRAPADIWPVFNALCVWCGEPGGKTCSSCRAVRYCGHTCQDAHWKHSHKPGCSIYKAMPRQLASPTI